MVPDEALVRLEACGICGTDYEQYEGEFPSPLPLIPGHEPLGLVAEIGERAQERWGVAVGDRVAVRSRYGCGQCEACARRDYRHCPQGGGYGFTSIDKPPALWGGYAEYLYIAPASALRKMRPDIPAEIAVLFNPLGAGFAWAVNVPQTRPGDTVAILGCGQRGLCAVIAAREAGAGQILITGLARDEHKLGLARELGADVTINVEAEDAVAVVREATGGGARVVLDTTPYAPQAVTQAIAMAAPRGTVVIAGLKGQRPVPEFYSDELLHKELTLRGVWGVDEASFEQAVRLIEAQKYPLHKLHTHSFDLSEAERAIQTLAGRFPSEPAIHVAIVPHARP
ncbi:MAG: putative alcohol dehydrogenase adh [Candidatus Tectimicrobiota bacterium]|nr:MAG: putative alcohol dehydrogenase adh [Candidatus Tectomicrobia bacterium]